MELIKKAFWASLILMFFASIAVTNVASASPATYIYVDPPLIAETPGGSFVVNINVTDAPSTYAWEAIVSWDPDRLELLSVTEGDFLHRWKWVPVPPPGKWVKAYATNPAFVPLAEANPEGKIRIGCALIGGLTPDKWASGNGWLCTLSFLAQASGDAHLGLSETRLWDHLDAGNPYPDYTYYDNMDGLVQATNFYCAGLIEWKLKVNGKAGTSEGGGHKTTVGTENLLEAEVGNTGTFDVYVQASIEIRDAAGLPVANPASSIILLHPGEIYIFSATWIADEPNFYYIKAYSFYWIQPPQQVTNVSVGIGDGVTRIFKLPLPPYPTSMVIPGSEKVYLNGVQTTAYTIDYTTGKITFTIAPAKYVIITADYTYFQRLPDGYTKAIRLKAI